jgi:hypothetical protein
MLPELEIAALARETEQSTEQETLLAQVVRLRIQKTPEGLSLVDEYILSDPPAVAYTPCQRQALQRAYAEPAFREYQRWQKEGATTPLEVLDRSINAGLIPITADGRMLFVVKTYDRDTRYALDLPAGCSKRRTGVNLTHTALREGTEETVPIKDGRLMIPGKEWDYTLGQLRQSYLTARSLGLTLPPDLENIIIQAACNRDLAYIRFSDMNGPSPLLLGLPRAQVRIHDPEKAKPRAEWGIFIKHPQGTDLLFECNLPIFSNDPNFRTTDLDFEGSTLFDRRTVLLNTEELVRHQQGERIETYFYGKNGPAMGVLDEGYPFAPLAEAFTGHLSGTVSQTKEPSSF